MASPSRTPLFKTLPASTGEPSVSRLSNLDFPLLGHRTEDRFIELLAPLLPYGPALLTFRPANGQFGPLRFSSRPAQQQPHTHPGDWVLLASEDDGEEFTCMISNDAGDYRVYPGALDTLHDHLTQRGRIHGLAAQATVDYLNARMYGLFDTPGGHSELLLSQLRDTTETSLNASVTLRHSGGHSAKLLLKVDGTNRPELRLSQTGFPEPIARSGSNLLPVTWHPQYAQTFRKAAQG